MSSELQNYRVEGNRMQNADSRGTTLLTMDWNGNKLDSSSFRNFRSTADATNYIRGQENGRAGSYDDNSYSFNYRNGNRSRYYILFNQSKYDQVRNGLVGAGRGGSLAAGRMTSPVRRMVGIPRGGWSAQGYARKQQQRQNRGLTRKQVEAQTGPCPPKTYRREEYWNDGTQETVEATCVNQPESSPNCPDSYFFQPGTTVPALRRGIPGSNNPISPNYGLTKRYGGFTLPPRCTPIPGGPAVGTGSIDPMTGQPIGAPGVDQGGSRSRSRSPGRRGRRSPGRRVGGGVGGVVDTRPLSPIGETGLADIGTGIGELESGLGDIEMGLGELGVGRGVGRGVGARRGRSSSFGGAWLPGSEDCQFRETGYFPTSQRQCGPNQFYRHGYVRDDTDTCVRPTCVDYPGSRRGFNGRNGRNGNGRNGFGSF